jgi:hypothetical protein
MRSLPVALAALGCALALPAAASAAYELGQNPDGVMEGTSTSCPAGCTIVQDMNANEQMRMPAWLGQQGVVVKWRVRGEGQARLQRIALDPDGTGTSPASTEPVQMTGVKQEVPASLPIRAGEAVGIQLSAGATVDSVDLGFGESTLTWSPALADTARQGTETAGELIAFQAVIEADADADGLGDETQDTCVKCGGPPPGGGIVPPPDNGGNKQPAQPADPYAEIRTSGPKATIARAASRKGSKVAVTVTNPYAFPISGKLQLKRGRKVVGKAKLKLGANASRTLNLKVRRPGRSLAAVATLHGPVGKARTTTKKLKVTTARPPKPGTGGIDGRYRGSGAGADWVMVIKDGVVTTFNGTITTYCTKAEEQETDTFAMIGDDPDPSVAADGTFAWEATSGYGFDKLKFDGRVDKGGTITGNMMVESRPPIPGADPLSGMPRIEFEYCFAGRDYTLKKG